MKETQQALAGDGMDGGIKDKFKTLKPSNTKNGSIYRNRAVGIEQATLPKARSPKPVHSLALGEFTQSQSEEPVLFVNMLNILLLRFPI